MSYWNGQFHTTGNFSLYTENTNNGWMEMEGTVDAVCDWERGDRDTPGSVNYDVDYDSTSVWGDVGWIDEQGDTHSLTVRFDGTDADAFLSAWGVDVAYEVEEWEEPDDV